MESKELEQLYEIADKLLTEKIPDYDYSWSMKFQHANRMIEQCRERELLEKAISLVKSQQRYMSGLPGSVAEGYNRGMDDAIKDAVATLEKLKEGL